MFDSGVSVKDLVKELKNTEVDVALEIPNSTYVTWLNSLQQLLYTEIIKEQQKVIINPAPVNPVIKIGTGENAPRVEDIHAVYADNVQLIKSTVTSGVIFPDTFYKDNNDICYHTESVPTELTIVYIAKPDLITVEADDEINDANVMVPIEFIDLVKAKLRGEAYKLANEDGIAAKWLNDFNTLLETFKAWIDSKSPSFGM